MFVDCYSEDEDDFYTDSDEDDYNESELEIQSLDEKKGCKTASPCTINLTRMYLREEEKRDSPTM